MTFVDALYAISILIGIWVSIAGINNWRKVHTGKRKIELAEDSLALFYEASDAINYLRHPFSYSSETEEIKRAENESEAAWEARKNASVVFYRYKQHQELFNKLYASRYRFMAQIGKEKAKPFEDLQKVINDIVKSARHLSRLWARDHFRTEKQWEDHQQRVGEQEAIFWADSVDNDPIIPRVTKVIEEMEAICSDVINGEKSIADILNYPLLKKANKLINRTENTSVNN
ncbi:MAG: hypothetical protein SCI25_02595 [Desulfuromonadales bacterium]|nr:hypothetical protein [Desulfuromonadales bacterium]MDW7757707.1 hypothetical protein [Desulfuromonadales bacterium]